MDNIINNIDLADLDEEIKRRTRITLDTMDQQYPDIPAEKRELLKRMYCLALESYEDLTIEDRKENLYQTIKIAFELAEHEIPPEENIRAFINANLNNGVSETRITGFIFKMLGLIEGEDEDGELVEVKEEE